MPLSKRVQLSPLNRKGVGLLWVQEKARCFQPLFMESQGRVRAWESIFVKEKQRISENFDSTFCFYLMVLGIRRSLMSLNGSLEKQLSMSLHGIKLSHMSPHFSDINVRYGTFLSVISRKIVRECRSYVLHPGLYYFSAV